MRYSNFASSVNYDGVVVFNSSTGASKGHLYGDFGAFWERRSKFAFINETHILGLIDKANSSWGNQVMCVWAIGTTTNQCR